MPGRSSPLKLLFAVDLYISKLVVVMEFYHQYFESFEPCWFKLFITTMNFMNYSSCKENSSLCFVLMHISCFHHSVACGVLSRSWLGDSVFILRSLFG